MLWNSFFVLWNSALCWGTDFCALEQFFVVKHFYCDVGTVFCAVEQFFVLWNSVLCWGTVFCAMEQFFVVKHFYCDVGTVFCAVEQFIVLWNSFLCCGVVFLLCLLRVKRGIAYVSLCIYYATHQDTYNNPLSLQQWLFSERHSYNFVIFLIRQAFASDSKRYPLPVRVWMSQEATKVWHFPALIVFLQSPFHRKNTLCTECACVSQLSADYEPKSGEWLICNFL